MTMSIDGGDIGQIIQIASWVGSIVAMLVTALIVYLLVRPPRHLRGRRGKQQERPAALDPAEAEDLWRLVDRMEMRLEVLERALADETSQARRPAIGGRETRQTLAPVEDDRDSGRNE
jgi:hypothetical protein